MSEEIRFEVTRDKDDYRSAGLAVALARGSIWWSAGIYAVGMGAFFTALHGLSFGLPAALICAALMAPVYAYVAWQAGATLAKKPGAQDPVVFTLTKDSFSSESTVLKLRLQWLPDISAIENERVLVIRQGGAVQVIPKRELDPDVLSETRALLREALPGRAKLRKDETK